MWRSEIPKVFAKKYLENSDMVQIYFDLGEAGIGGSLCFLEAELIFDRYEGKANERCVFTEHSSTGNTANGENDRFSQQYQHKKNSVWRNGLSTYLGGSRGAREDAGGRFDLPPYQIRIKSRARDSDLPNLAFDFNKREISFEWEGMFLQFFRECTMLERAELKIMMDSMRWHEEAGDRTTAGALAHAKQRDEALRDAVRKVRRHRIARYYIDNQNSCHTETLFDEEEEDKALDAIQEFELRSDFTRCAEDTESMERAEAHSESQDVFSVLNAMREAKGVREDDEYGLMAMLIELMGAGIPPCDDADDRGEEEYMVGSERTGSDDFNEGEGEDGDGSEGVLSANDVTGRTTSSNVD